MKIIVARHSGFCMGVRMAMNTILKTAHELDQPIQTLGPLIHNPQTMELLRKKRVTLAATPAEVRTATVVIRTHGVPPEVRGALNNRRLNVIDATCPHVKRIHDILDEHTREGRTILIFGDAGHAEVVGLLGYARGRGRLIHSPEDLAAFAPEERICLVAQTTQGLREYQAIKDAATARFADAAVYDTVCRATDRRQTEVESLARQTDAVVVVGGKNSANSARLAVIARRHNPRVFHIETERELSPSDFEGLKSVAVVSGASTPSWLLNRVTDHLKAISNSRRPAPVRWLHTAVDMFVAFNGYLALSAVLMTWTASNLQHHNLITHPLRLSYLLVAALYINSMYILNRITNISANQFEEIFQTDLILKYRRFSMLLCLATGLSSMALAFRLGRPEFTLIVIACVAGVLYHVPLLPRNNLPLLRHRKFKDIALSKDVGISLAWSVVCVSLPWLQTEWPAGRPDRAAFFTLAFIFVLVFNRSLYHDLHDIQRDLIVGRETLPILMGRRFRKFFPLTPQLLIAVIPLTGVAIGALPLRALLLALCPVYLAGVHALFKRNKLSDTTRFDMVVDFSLILPGVLLWLATV